MRTKRKIAVVTGGRADFGILYWPIREIEASPNLECQLIVTGSHLATSLGETISEIKTEGFRIAASTPMLVDGDDDFAIANSIGLGVLALARDFAHLQPDIVLLMGDRFETFAAATAAMALRIPIAHIAGGETDWANCLDSNIRNAITKLSHLHFVSTEEYAERVREMGEEHWRIHMVGLPSIDHITEDLLGLAELEASLGIKLGKPLFLVTYLPVVFRPEESINELNALLRAFDDYPEATVFFTLSNADAGGRKVSRIIQSFVDEHDNASSLVSLGRRRYLSMLNMADVVLGNSSSGLIETPSFKVSNINIGVRQGGRIRAANVIDVPGDAEQISAAIRYSLHDDKFRRELDLVRNPFGDGHASERIAKTLAEVTIDKGFMEKRLVSNKIKVTNIS